MIIDRNYTADPIESLYEGIQEIGSEKQRDLSVELMSQHDVESVADERAELRNKMMVLLASADWHYQFTPPAEARRRENMRRNLGAAA